MYKNKSKSPQIITDESKTKYIFILLVIINQFQYDKLIGAYHTLSNMN